jgi:hypothetical protein
VGGYYRERGLSDIALQWMMKRAEEKGLKLDFGDNIQPNPLTKIHNSWTGLFWFTPWHIYAVLFLALMLVVQLIFAGKEVTLSLVKNVAIRTAQNAILLGLKLIFALNVTIFISKK